MSRAPSNASAPRSPPRNRAHPVTTVVTPEQEPDADGTVYNDVLSNNPSGEDLAPSIISPSVHSRRSRQTARKHIPSQFEEGSVFDVQFQENAVMIDQTLRTIGLDTYTSALI